MIYSFNNISWPDIQKVIDVQGSELDEPITLIEFKIKIFLIIKNLFMYEIIHFIIVNYRNQW